MQRNLLGALVAGALAAGAASGAAAQTRYIDEYTFRIARAPDWNLAAAEGRCHLRLYVDDKARVELRGDQIVVRTESGRRSYDQGSVCNQPLPLHPVDDFRVMTERGRGAVYDVATPAARNNYIGGMTIHDPQNDGETYELVVAWRNPAAARGAPVASADPFPYYDQTRACQDRVRGDFVARNRGGDAYLEFTSVPVREDAGVERERIRGEAWARNRVETRPVSYECIVDMRDARVMTSRYEVRARDRFSSLY